MFGLYPRFVNLATLIAFALGVVVVLGAQWAWDYFSPDARYDRELRRAAERARLLRELQGPPPAPQRPLIERRDR
jgi:hypothetical protein